MGEKELIAATRSPIIQSQLESELCSLGLSAGSTVIVHSSLSSLGWVCGGAVAVVSALLNAIGPQGTLVMPTHSSDLTDPALWETIPVPADWQPIIRAHMPPFDPAWTPSFGMGAVAECLRTHPRALRSNHPHDSFAAIGPLASKIVETHSLEFSLGERSPLKALFDLDTTVLLLGVGYDACTALHLAEHRANYLSKKIITNGAPLLEEGRSRWVTFSDFYLDSADFESLGADFEEEGNRVRKGRVGSAIARLISFRELVTFGIKWLERTRS